MTCPGVDVPVKVMYLDCYSGISGDMFLGALLDAGLSLASLREMLSGLDLKGYRLKITRVRQHGISGTRVKVLLEEPPVVERSLPTITVLMERSNLPQAVRDRSVAVFRGLAQAEARVHGVAPEAVHFHEVGAVDAIIDIVGAVAGLHLLEIGRLVCSPLPLGRGMVQTAHGFLPLPAPATLELLKERGVPVKGVDAAFELVTPTGAALVSVLADSFGPFPLMDVLNVGYGAGSHEPGYPNFLRVVWGKSPVTQPREGEETVLMESNIDDLSPEVFGYLMDRLLTAGALDVFYTPIQMKKNRPAVKLSLLCRPELASSLRELVCAETGTLGVRLTRVEKFSRPRSLLTVETGYGPVRVKYSPAPAGGLPQSFSPEYEDCRKIAERSGLPLQEVYRRAVEEFSRDKKE